MIVSCPKCASKLQVPDEAAGQHTSCPACGLVFPIAQVQATQTVAPSLQPSAAGAVVSPQGQKLKERGRGLLITMAVFLLSGGVAMGVSFFPRWWSVYADCRFANMTPEEQQSQQIKQQFLAEAKSFTDIREAARSFYNERLSRSNLDNFASLQNEIDHIRSNNRAASQSLFGYNFGVGVMTFVFASAVLLLVLLQIIFRLARRLGWALNFLVAAMAIISFIMDLVLLVRLPASCSPGRYVNISQQLFAGVWIAVAASAFVAVWGLATAITGLVIFLRGLRVPAGQAITPQSQNVSR